jgi:hypothetical protein
MACGERTGTNGPLLFAAAAARLRCVHRHSRRYTSDTASPLLVNEVLTSCKLLPGCDCFPIHAVVVLTMVGHGCCCGLTTPGADDGAGVPWRWPYSTPLQDVFLDSILLVSCNWYGLLACAVWMVQ